MVATTEKKHFIHRWTPCGDVIVRRHGWVFKNSSMCTIKCDGKGFLFTFTFIRPVMVIFFQHNKRRMKHTTNRRFSVELKHVARELCRCVCFKSLHGKIADEKNAFGREKETTSSQLVSLIIFTVWIQSSSSNNSKTVKLSLSLKLTDLCLDGRLRTMGWKTWFVYSIID